MDAFPFPLPYVTASQFDFHFVVSNDGSLITEASMLQASGFNHAPLTVEWPDGHRETFTKQGALPDKRSAEGELEVYFLRSDRGTVMHIIND